jgi:tRNA G18 (ribose-2'-O)-methylase SpoU
MSLDHLQTIASFDAPELEPYRTMRRPKDHEAQGIFVAEGDKVVQRLLESQFTVRSVVLPENRLEEFRAGIEARPEKVAVYLADRKFLQTLVGIELFQGVLAVGQIPQPMALADLLALKAAPKLLAAVDGLTNAENIGLLVRNCAAFGLHGLIVSPTSASPFLRRAVRNSMGAVFQLPVVELGLAGQAGGHAPAPSSRQTTSLAEALQILRGRGIRCIAAHPHTDKSLAQADFTGDCCLVFGSEGTGISPEVLAACDEAVAIPMPPKIDSLNVGAAAAVFLYEAKRQRMERG